ncbi:MAG: DUF455 family protein, partial [Chthoniobacterales bacterium]
MKIIARENRSHFTVGSAAKVLKRFYFLQREMVLMQAGWLPGTAHLETKLALAEGMWQDALIAGQLRQRVLELRYPERRIDLEEDESLLAIIKTLQDAPSGTDFYHALQKTLKPFVRSLYSTYLEVTDLLDDGPTVRILGHALLDIEQQHRNYKPSADENPNGLHGAWQAAVHRLIAGLEVSTIATGISCDPPLAPTPLPDSMPFEIARHAARDKRFANPAFAWPDRLNPARGAGQGLELQVRAAVHHLNEVWATEMAAAVLYDLAEEAPPEFLEDAARWCFDESRHCRMGYMRLKEFGYQPTEIPVDSFSYDAGADLDPLARLGIIFYFETTFIHTKSERTKIFAEFGDSLSSHDMDYDWADELIHTYYG